MPANLVQPGRGLAPVPALCDGTLPTGRAQHAARVPADAVFKPAKLQRATMSPDGRWLAALTSVPGRRIGFMMIDLDGKETSAFIEASPKDDVSWFRWMGSDWLLVSTAARDGAHRRAHAGVVRAGDECAAGALMGLAKDPDQYRCGTARAAVSDPRLMYDFHWSDASAFGREFSLPVVLGDRKKDEALLIAASPLEQVARIKAPLLLSHGGRDRRVPIDNSERMLDALRKAGKQVEWVPYAEEGHSFFFEENRIDCYRRVEAFLAKHLK